MTTPTPRTDAILEIASIEDRYLPLRDLARQLERDLAAAQERAQRAEAAVKLCLDAALVAKERIDAAMKETK